MIDILFQRWYRNRKIKEFAKLIHNKSILEIGSGKSSKYSVERFFDKSNFFVKSDINPEYGHHIVDISKNYAKSYDIIICLNVLEHIKTPRVAIYNIYQSLNNNGILIMLTPFAFPLHDEPEDYYRYTEYALRDLLSPLFYIGCVKYHGIRKFPFSYYIECIKR